MPILRRRIKDQGDRFSGSLKHSKNIYRVKQLEDAIIIINNRAKCVNN